MTNATPEAARAKTVSPRKRVGVVIPFYQEHEGVLVAALRSIFAQNLPQHVFVDVIIVDDSSPVCAKAELTKLAAHETGKVRIIRQPNAGPAAARNRGLDALAPDTEFVAFLDSDDLWDPEHLRVAIAALDEGHDAYFANNWVEPAQDWFSAHPKSAAWLDRASAEQDAVITLSADRAVALLIEEPLIHLSTLVFGRRLTELRFERALLTGEDHLYTLLLADASCNLAANVRPMMTRGAEGVNFYRGALDWNSPRSTWRALTTVCKYRRIAELMAHRGEVAALAKAKAATSRDEVVFLFMRNFWRYPFANLKVLRAAIGRAGWGSLAAIPAAAALLLRRCRGPLEFRS